MDGILAIIMVTPFLWLAVPGARGWGVAFSTLALGAGVALVCAGMLGATSRPARIDPPD